MSTLAPQRCRDWQARLQAFVCSRLHMPFEWGSNDCCLFVADGVRAITGHDPAADVRGKYRTERGALRMIQRFGGLQAIGAARFGAEIAPAFAQAGDVGLLTIDDRQSLALCAGDGWIGAGAQGLVRAPLAAATMAWRCV